MRIYLHLIFKEFQMDVIAEIREIIIRIIMSDIIYINNLVIIIRHYLNVMIYLLKKKHNFLVIILIHQKFVQKD